MKVGNLSILQELLQVRQKLLIKCETYNIPQGGWKKEAVLEGKIKCCSSDRWCSTKGQPLAHSAAHYLLTIFLTLALLQESSVMQIIKRYFIVQGLLQVQQKVCKVISVLQGTFEDACARRAQPACKVKMKWKSFVAHLPGLSLTQTFQSHFPHLTQNRTAKVTYATVSTGCNSSQVVSATVQQETFPIQLPDTWAHHQGLHCSFHGSHDSSRDRESAITAMQQSQRTSSHSTPGEQSLSHDGHTREVLCSPATIPSLLEQRTCNCFFFQLLVWALRTMSSNNSHDTATNCPAQENPERSHWQNKETLPLEWAHYCLQGMISISMIISIKNKNIMKSSRAEISLWLIMNSTSCPDSL